MSKNQRLKEAQAILRALQLPKAQTNERAGYVLLALAAIKVDSSWKGAQQPLLTIHNMMGFMREHHDKSYAENSRETIRRQCIHQLEQARIVTKNRDDPARPTNSGATNYSLSDEVLRAIMAFEDSEAFASEVQTFLDSHGSLAEAYAKRRDLHLVPVLMPDGSELQLSPCRHNELQAALIEELAPRFAPGAVVLYLGDTAAKYVVFENERLAEVSATSLL